MTTIGCRALAFVHEWRFVHLAADAVLVSYRVHAPVFAWTAYAASVWVRRADRWLTVFHQASRAAPREAAAPHGAPAS
jgi:hypothetical protein